MTAKHPAPKQIPQLLRLWKDVFGEYNGFWELFLETAFAPERCLCITETGSITASLCWLDCRAEGQKTAYIYAVVTHPDCRVQGLCRRLMADAHAHLKAQGYSCALLVPAEEGLREMYRRLGYRDATYVREFTCDAPGSPVSLRAIGPEEYAALRRELLPRGGVIQEGENLAFLSRQAQFYVGKDFLMAAYAEEDTLTAMELLGNASEAPGILAALGCKKGRFRTPGTERAFAMAYPLREDAVIPKYFGFAFD